MHSVVVNQETEYFSTFKDEHACLLDIVKTLYC